MTLPQETCSTRHRQTPRQSRTEQAAGEEHYQRVCRASSGRQQSGQLAAGLPFTTCFSQQGFNSPAAGDPWAGPPGMPKMAGNTTCSRCFLPGEGDGDSELTAWLSGWPRLQELALLCCGIMGEKVEREEDVAVATHHAAGLATTDDVERIEAPVTWKAYLICAFASFGGIFFGYDSGYINGVLAADIFIKAVEGPTATSVSESHQSLIVSILSCGTFFGAVIAGDLADWIGRKWTVILGCLIYIIGVVIQTITGLGDALAAIVAGRLIAGIGVGFESAIVILYMSEICPRKVRGALVAGYQFCITIGLMLASCVIYATEDRTDTGSYRIPIAIQFVWALILAFGLMCLPDSPRYFVKKGNLNAAAASLSRLRGQPENSEYIQVELAEIVANEEYERQLIPATTWLGSWANCFKGSLWKSNSNLRKTILGTSLQMMQQWTGVNFIFYYSTPFLKSTGAIKDSFLMSMVFTIINVFSTPVSFYTVERFGRRTILFWGALGMLICQFLVAIIGVTVGFNHTHPDPADPEATLANNVSAVNAQIAFIAIFIFFFASTWGPGAWIVIGEIFPLPIRSRGVGLSTASNWLWNTIIAVITPYMVGENRGNMKSSVFFVWGGLCTVAWIYTYFLVPETKGLTLEQVDKMMEETTPRTSAKWKPTTTFSAGGVKVTKGAGSGSDSKEVV
ncbi:putative transporter protein [Thermochaetoides thermophila DSM 1495]|uniref:Putative transporter protein n=1 Tax=Chaetomium thermophilum (strain DSM 1495 / CBS 144.50 / IMI 039719) TaxID=759272 RepID=G0S312_CHATD|nr:putative transporter protein [Thermochaetoides thermophila DSM 1495]EGS22395.1 putative transporter protein [Thermochaetoides thermophila DSM 1495]